tara:strand:+ start:661 stop:1419 length:759 start_codon:yes stop_codon:yes gene_type:complete
VNTNKIAIVCNYRTASTTFTLMKAEEYDLPYGGEAFSHEKAQRVGSIPSRIELQQSYQIMQYEILDLIQSDANLMTELRNPSTQLCFKIMPWQVRDDYIIKQILESVDKIYYLYRRDFEATCKSWIAVRRWGDFGKTGFKYQSNNFTYERIREQHLGLLGKDEKHIVEVDPNDPFLNGGMGVVTVPNCINQIRDNYERMKWLYKLYPGELICMEDYFVRDKWRPYNKQVNWVEEIDIPHYDVESGFAIDKDS